MRLKVYFEIQKLSVALFVLSTLASQSGGE